MNKVTTISIIIAALIIGGGILLASRNNSNHVADTGVKAEKNIVIDNQGNSTTTIPDEQDIKSVTVSSNVNIEKGVQIIDLQAKGGYSPRQSIARAGIPTIIRFTTNGTFDCSASIRIPSLNISKYLPQTGDTDINIGTPAVGLFRGSCGMGMYPFEVDFQ